MWKQQRYKIFLLTFHCDFVLSGVRVSENLHMDGHFSYSIVHPRAWRDRTKSKSVINTLESPHLHCANVAAAVPSISNSPP